MAPISFTLAKKKMNKEQRALHLLNWQKSGQTKKAYSESVGIKYGTFISWFMKKVPLVAGRFKKLENKGESEELAQLEIVLPNGVRIYSSQKLSLALLKDLHRV